MKSANLSNVQTPLTRLGVVLACACILATPALAQDIDHCKDVLISRISDVKISNWAEFDEHLEWYFRETSAESFRDTGDFGGGAKVEIAGISIGGSGSVQKKRFEELKREFESSGKHNRAEKVVQLVSKWNSDGPSPAAIKAWSDCMSKELGGLSHTCRKVGDDYAISIGYKVGDMGRLEVSIVSIEHLGLLPPPDTATMRQDATLTHNTNLNAIFRRDPGLAAQEVPVVLVYFKKIAAPYEIPVFPTKDCRPPKPVVLVGACCKTGNCENNVPKRDCSETLQTWTQGVVCSDLKPLCLPAGACCQAAECQGQVLKSNCTGKWYEGKNCSDLKKSPCVREYKWDLVFEMGDIDHRDFKYTTPGSTPHVLYCNKETVGKTAVCPKGESICRYKDATVDAGWDISGGGHPGPVYVCVTKP